MNHSRRFPVVGIPLLLLISSLNASGQWDKKPQAEWTEKDAIKVLNDSPWGRTQTFTSPMEQYRGPVTGRQGVGNQTTNAPPNALQLNFRVRFLSAKPIRQALTRMMELKFKGRVKDDVAEQLKQFASGEFLEIIVVAVSVDAEATGANVQQALGLCPRAARPSIRTIRSWR